MFNTFNTDYFKTDYLKPVQELTALNVAQFEKLAGLQVELVNELSTAGITSLKKANYVTSIESAKTYFEEQAASIKTLGESAIARSKDAVEISKDYPNKVKSILEKAVA